MGTLKKVLAISGSTRRSSTNLNLIKAIADLTRGKIDIHIFDGLSDIPHFNPDRDTENPPVTVTRFRNAIKEADGIIICTPEYAMGVPGTLKNAIDWTVSSCEFSQKPVTLITASSLGENAHQSLLLTLRIIESNITERTQLLIAYARTKVNSQNEITDVQTLADVNELIENFIPLLG